MPSQCCFCHAILSWRYCDETRRYRSTYSRFFSHHLRRFAQLIETLSLKEVSGRIATYLLLLSHQSGDRAIVELDITKAQLAAFIGTVPETLSRVLQKMGRDGLLKLDGNTITILDFPALKALAGCRSPRVMF